MSLGSMETMIGAAIQRFAILPMLLGGFLELDSEGGVGVVPFALLVGVVGLFVELRPQATDT